ncbi:MAG: ABC transporter permease subunit [Pseudomonadaceae bacterium]|nr:ABC transporter permease subunit [Pseudomonadaceae bacterium]
MAVTIGGFGVISAILLLFAYLVWVTIPLFLPASITPGKTLPMAAQDVLFADVNDTAEWLLVLDAKRRAMFVDLATGTSWSAGIADNPNEQMVAAQPLSGSLQRYAILDSQGALRFYQARYPVSFVDGDRRIDARLAPLFEGDALLSPGLDVGGFVFDAYFDGDRLLIANSVATDSGREISLRRYSDADPDFSLEQPTQSSIALDKPLLRLLFGPQGRWLYGLVGERSDAAELVVWSVSRTGLTEQSRLAVSVSTLTSITPLAGRQSVIVASPGGELAQYSLLRSGSRFQMRKIREFAPAPETNIVIAESRRKSFATLSASGELSLYHATSGQRLEQLQIPAGVWQFAAFSPRADRLVLLANSQLRLLDVANPHPEVSLRTLWQRVWYEGYDEPVFTWQSSSADNDIEPKFSLTPLLFGTLKAAAYALLFAVPIAVMAAIYTAFFMAPALRSVVKPGIELLAALPTVILGFLAGLWLAPLIERNLSAVLSIAVVLPPGVLLLGALWRLLPTRLYRLARGWHVLILMLPIVLLVVVAFAVGPVLEIQFFGGNSKVWLREVAGLDYDQRNALVVGLAMGLAVIPTIFTIAEDAVYQVPDHLRSGALALGANHWQTLTRVVILTASPGIFSAIMVGMGRAVGETMIVLMATGNTPIMELNIFEGMRTFAANIAVELPESEINSSHFRLLFLTAAVLFVITFAFNTIAELVRARLRTKYGNL